MIRRHSCFLVDVFVVLSRLWFFCLGTAVCESLYVARMKNQNGHRGTADHGYNQCSSAQRTTCRRRCAPPSGPWRPAGGPPGAKRLDICVEIYSKCASHAFVLIEQLFPPIFLFFFQENRKSRKNTKHLQSLEILQRAKYLEGFAFQYFGFFFLTTWKHKKIPRFLFLKFFLDKKSFDKNGPFFSKYQNAKPSKCFALCYISKLWKCFLFFLLFLFSWKKRGKFDKKLLDKNGPLLYSRRESDCGFECHAKPKKHAQTDSCCCTKLLATTLNRAKTPFSSR